MRLLLGLLTYLLATVAIVGGTGAFLFSAAAPAVTVVMAQQDAPKVAPRIQAWLDRKAEARAYAEREKAAALAEKERAEALRVKLASPPAHAAFARARDNEEKQAIGRQKKRDAKREARKRSRELRAAESSASSHTSHAQPSQYYPDLHGQVH